MSKGSIFKNSKEGCVYTMVIWPEIRTRQQRDESSTTSFMMEAARVLIF